MERGTGTGNRMLIVVILDDERKATDLENRYVGRKEEEEAREQG